MEKVKWIVELRELGLTWHEVDCLVFPGTSKEQSKKHSPSWHLAKKAGPAGEGAFSKIVLGGWGPTQIVVPLRKHKKVLAPGEGVRVQDTVPAQVEMFI